MDLFLPDADATELLGKALADALSHGQRGAVVALSGPLGAGKSALARATIHALGHDGAVVSPSYTLIEPYAVAGRQLYHMDLYRLADPGELEYLGLRDLDPARDTLLIEWPQHGQGFLPATDLDIALDYAGRNGVARLAQLAARSDMGRLLLSGLRRYRDAAGLPEQAG